VHQGLALALAVHVGGVEEVDAAVEGRAQQADEAAGVALEDAADAGAAEAELRNPEVGLAERSNQHPAQYRRPIRGWEVVLRPTSDGNGPEKIGARWIGLSLDRERDLRARVPRRGRR